MTAIGEYVRTQSGRSLHLRTTPPNRTVCGQFLGPGAYTVYGSAWLPVCRRCAARSRPGELRA